MVFHFTLKFADAETAFSPSGAPRWGLTGAKCIAVHVPTSHEVHRDR